MTYEEIIVILDLNKFPTTTIGYTLPSEMYEIMDNNFMLKSLLPKEVKVEIATDDVKLK